MRHIFFILALLISACDYNVVEPTDATRPWLGVWHAEGNRNTYCDSNSFEPVSYTVIVTPRSDDSIWVAFIDDSTHAECDLYYNISGENASFGPFQECLGIPWSSGSLIPEPFGVPLEGGAISYQRGARGPVGPEGCVVTESGTWRR